MLLGHKSGSTTEIYTHVANTSLNSIKNPLDWIVIIQKYTEPVPDIPNFSGNKAPSNYFDMKNLEKKLKEIKKLINELRDVYLKNEQAVRDQLINPVLNELGWITSNPRFVRPDSTNQDGKIPDYTLLKNSKDTLIVEAKNLGTDVDNNKIIEQLAGYCYSLNLGFDFGILTNGEKWLLFNTFEKNPAERIVWIADLKTESIENVSRKISSFSYQNIEKLATLIELSKNLELVWDSLIENTRDIGKVVAEQIKSRLRKDYPKTKIEHI